MSKRLNQDESLETLIAQINELLNELENEQTNIEKNILNNHKACMQRLSKIIEHTKFLEKSNLVLEKKVSSIEKLLYEVFKN